MKRCWASWAAIYVLRGGDAGRFSCARKEWNPRRSGLEVTGPPEEIPAVGKLTRKANVVSYQDPIQDGPWSAALGADDGIHLPAFEELPFGFYGGNRVSKRQRETMPNVEIARGAFKRRREAVLRLDGPIKGGVVNGMRIGVRSKKPSRSPRSIVPPTRDGRAEVRRQEKLP